MKKLTIALVSALCFSVAQATPPLEGIGLDGNDFVLGADISAIATTKKDSVGAPYLYSPSMMNGQRIALPTYTKEGGDSSDQINALLNINARYGFLDYFEIFGNANGYFEYTYSKYAGEEIAGARFANANIGLLVTLYKGEYARVAIGDNSDIISNVVFDRTASNMQFFKGHTFFLNSSRTKTFDGGLTLSTTGQIYYRLNLNQSYKDLTLKSGDEFGVNVLWQISKDKTLSFLRATLALRNPDAVNGTEFYKGDMFSGLGTGFSVGAKRDFNKHLGIKFSFDFMSYSFTYDAYNTGVTFGLYFK
ncbi:hypothetical protein BKH41_07970 [Helicobacter sp. 12S02232-10]|uniref:hypothetical protein n=1 Tax=Helicobacter sp. 12S02232-10 TaxID=1476197 RepID=UPI000BA5437C|nr:hypothetical protein [Helicobacter sp. 12S02232-10]PAF47208.1 hypothetical protein BKH41_07970 [Helicobacter sp. 12S02232-10]